MQSKIKSSKIIFHEFLKVEKSLLAWERSDGRMGREHTRYVVRRGDSVGIVPLCAESSRVVLVNQFRFPAVREGEDGYLWEIPAGMVDDGEESVTTARRELQEETGLTCESIEHLISYYLSPGLLDEKMHLYYALIPHCRDLKRAGGNPAEDEDLRLQAFRRKEVLQMIRHNEIVDAKSIAGLLYFFCIFKGM
jgi:ADP-ribose pyrophosphatase